MLELRAYQREAVEALYSWFHTHEEGNPLLVLPTAAGKSLIAAKVCEDALQFPNQRLLILTHVQELVGQNYKAMLDLWPEAPAGIYSAGLNRRQSHHPITFASIQSVYRKSNVIGWRDLVIIDEAHLIGDSDSSMYRSFLEGLKAINPHIRVVGLSATPYRMKSGYLHEGEGALFSDIAFELSIMRLVKEGYLSPLISKGAVTQGKTDNMAMQAGDFALREVISEFDREEMTTAAVSEMVEFGKDRKAWIIFCASIEHAIHVRDALRASGIEVETISNKTEQDERTRILADFKAGRLRAITNVSVLTTGFDAPSIDMIVLLRPTMSPGLLVQMCGRGMRLFPGKENCLVLDMASNLERHGPITHIRPQAGSRKHKLDRDGKMCPKCRTVVEILAKECADCGHIFEGAPRKIKHTTRASRDAPMSEEPPITNVPAWFNVKFIKYDLHTKMDGSTSLKVMYKTEAQWVMQWIAFASPKDFARQKAAEWWVARGGQYPIPMTPIMALQRIHELSNYVTKRIRVKKNGKYDEIVGWDLAPAQTTIQAENGNLGTTFTQELADVTAQAV